MEICCENCKFEEVSLGEMPCKECGDYTLYESKENDTQTDIINNPDHYTHGMECIEEMILIFGLDEVLSFCKLNAWK